MPSDDQHQFNRRILAFPRDGNIYTERLYAEIEQRGVRVIQGVWSKPWLAENLRKGDVLHIHWLSFLYLDLHSRLRSWVRLGRLYALLRFAKRRGATIVWTAHNLYPHDGGAEPMHRVGRKIIVGAADFVCVHGPSAGQIVVRELRVPAERLLTARHGHWIDSYPNTLTRTQCRARLNIDAKEYLYLHVGRCRPYKGLEALIAAFPRASQPSTLLIAGKFSSPQYRDGVAALASRTSRVVLVPHSIPDDEMQVYLNAADCVVLPYRAVLTSGTVVLALSFGRPVIAPDLGAMRDHIDSSSGILYDPNDAAALGNALQEVQKRVFDPAVIVERTRRFTWAALADLLVDLPR